MVILIDLILIVLIALFTFIGYKQGLVKAIIKMLSFVIAIVVALIIYKPVSNLIINNTQLDENIKNTIMQKITPEGIKENEEIEVTDNLVVKLVGGTLSTIEEISEAFAVKLIELCTLLLILIIVKIALKFVSALSNLVTKIPLIKQVNEIGGLVYGLVKGVLIVYVILAIVYLLAPVINKNIVNTINETFITKNIYNHNIILNIFM